MTNQILGKRTDVISLPMWDWVKVNVWKFPKQICQHHALSQQAKGNKLQQYNYENDSKSDSVIAEPDFCWRFGHFWLADIDLDYLLDFVRFFFF